MKFVKIKGLIWNCLLYSGNKPGGIDKAEGIGWFSFSSFVYERAAAIKASSVGFSVLSLYDTQ